MFAKTLFYLFVIPVLGFNQILYSETFPFQNISDKTDAEVLYKLILSQNLFENIEIEKYLKTHKNIAILPVEIHYMSSIKTKTSKNLKKIELLSSKCIYNEFIGSFRKYSENFINLQSELKNNDSKKHIPQTEINRYLEEQDQSRVKKHISNIQDINITIQQLGNLKNVKMDNYTPEFLCSFLAVDAIIYIYIYSDIVIPLKNCFTPELIDGINPLDRDLLLKLESPYNTLQGLKKSKFKNKKIYIFTSIYDKSGDLIWLYGQDYAAYDVWNTIASNYAKTHKIDFVNTFFSKSFRFFPYLDKVKIN
tara:strand:+ start:227 stop:1147 length:921 start_codon:yes stop_codon:yes gene_type:complete